MIIAIVTFKIDSELTELILKEKFLETSPIYKDIVLIIWRMQRVGLMKIE